MRNFLYLIALAGACLCATPSVQADEPLRIRVSPTLSLAPGAVIVRASVPKAAENRRLEVVAESSDYYRRSQIQLDGEDAPQLSVVEFKGLPTGDYQITAVLVGSNGPRASALKLAKVAPAVGSGR